jgi:hypothetical protein
MTNAEILAELDKIMAQLMEENASPSIMGRLAALRAAIARKPADPPSPLSGGGPGPK